jgi:ubiquitin-conjugating enzyme E2 D/E
VPASPDSISGSYSSFCSPHPRLSSKSHKMTTFRRINKELTNLLHDPLESCSAAPSSDENILHWTGLITGPPNTPYEGGTFHLTIEYPELYPRHPPRLTFTTPVFHPNVSSQGEIGMGEIYSAQWSPAFTARTMLVSLQAMLSDPIAFSECVLNEEAAKLRSEDLGRFEEKARRWTVSHAMSATTTMSPDVASG